MRMSSPKYNKKKTIQLLTRLKQEEKILRQRGLEEENQVWKPGQLN